MSLINCPECGKEISDKAKKCINCGIKINNSCKKSIIITLILLLIFIITSIKLYNYYINNYNSTDILEDVINENVVITFDGGQVTQQEYEIYYKTFAEILEYYNYSIEEIPEAIAKKIVTDKVIVGLAKEKGMQLSEENQNSLNEIFNNDKYIKEFESKGMDIDKTRELYYNDYLISQYCEEFSDKEIDKIEDDVENNKNLQIDFNKINQIIENIN